MKGWVGLVGWPIADGLPTLVVTHQLQVERRTGKVRRPETDVLPLCHATNLLSVMTPLILFSCGPKEKVKAYNILSSKTANWLSYVRFLSVVCLPPASCERIHFPFRKFSAAPKQFQKGLKRSNTLIRRPQVWLNIYGTLVHIEPIYNFKSKSWVKVHKRGKIEHTCLNVEAMHLRSDA